MTTSWTWLRRFASGRGRTTTPRLDPDLAHIESGVGVLDLVGEGLGDSIANALTGELDVARVSDPTGLLRFRHSVVTLPLTSAEPTGDAAYMFGLLQALSTASRPARPAVSRFVIVWSLAADERLDAALRSADAGKFAPDLLCGAWARELRHHRASTATAVACRDQRVRAMVHAYGRIGIFPASSLVTSLDAFGGPHHLHAVVIRVARPDGPTFAGIDGVIAAAQTLQT